LFRFASSRREKAEVRAKHGPAGDNLFDVDPPPCFTCGLNNMDPTTYDVPGTFFYGRVSVKLD